MREPLDARGTTGAKITFAQSGDSTCNTAYCNCAAKDTLIASLRRKLAEAKANISDLDTNLNGALSELRGVMSAVQRIQPAGSPPPGGSTMLASWIIREVQARITAAEGLIAHLGSWQDKQGHFYDLTNPEAQVQPIIDRITMLEAENARLREACRAALDCKTHFRPPTIIDNDEVFSFGGHPQVICDSCVERLAAALSPATPADQLIFRDALAITLAEPLVTMQTKDSGVTWEEVAPPADQRREAVDDALKVARDISVPIAHFCAMCGHPGATLVSTEGFMLHRECMETRMNEAGMYEPDYYGYDYTRI